MAPGRLARQLQFAAQHCPRLMDPGLELVANTGYSGPCPGDRFMARIIVLTPSATAQRSSSASTAKAGCSAPGTSPEVQRVSRWPKTHQRARAAVIGTSESGTSASARPRRRRKAAPHQGKIVRAAEALHQRSHHVARAEQAHHTRAEQRTSGLRTVRHAEVALPAAAGRWRAECARRRSPAASGNGNAIGSMPTIAAQTISAGKQRPPSPNTRSPAPRSGRHAATAAKRRAAQQVEQGPRCAAPGQHTPAPTAPKPRLPCASGSTHPWLRASISSETP